MLKLTAEAVEAVEAVEASEAKSSSASWKLLPITLEDKPEPSRRILGWRRSGEKVVWRATQ